jgi:DNA repair protein RadA/Sms
MRRMSKTLFVCQNCGAEHRKWMGQCPDCLAWNSIAEEVPAEMPHGAGGKAEPLAPDAITAIDSQAAPRQSSGIDELDRVLGGGIVPGSAVLLGGEPGIGKSTLLLQAAARFAAHGPVLYVTGEESAQQVRMRGERIDALHAGLQLAAGTELEGILATAAKLKPGLLIVDSIQTTTTNRLTSAPGTVAQVRDCASALIRQAKKMGHALILIGHVTKDGSIAGPRVLGYAHRILRAVKNRFGPAGEIGVFEMSDAGLIGIRDASRIFLAERAKDTPGSVVLACLEGTRPLLVEVQALVAPTVYATPKRSAVGLDPARVAMLTAVLERRIGIPLSSQDIYVNVAGGARIQEPAADLAVLLAVISAYRDKPLASDIAVFGEVGLTGEVRPVGQPEARVREAASLGFSRVMMSRDNQARVQDADLVAKMRRSSKTVVDCIPVHRLADAVQAGLA